ncbi:MAG: hypothetical protein MK102_13040 [Fuerstiella sp.]|nr:hypothetical protein [Fuerstiella sp.]
MRASGDSVTAVNAGFAIRECVICRYGPEQHGASRNRDTYGIGGFPDCFYGVIGQHSGLFPFVTCESPGRTSECLLTYMII